jgi:competence protein ComEA
MSLPSDHKALLFIGAIAVLGAGVRVARATSDHAPAQQPALERQMQAADSSKRKLVAKRRGKASAQSPHSPAPQASAPSVTQSATSRINGRLDLDVATAAQIDSLPGVGPSLARKIVLDRAARGPFSNLVALKRVKSMSAKTLQHLDTLVMFSGTITRWDPADTIIPRGRVKNVLTNPP